MDGRQELHGRRADLVRAIAVSVDGPEVLFWPPREDTEVVGDRVLPAGDAVIDGTVQNARFAVWPLNHQRFGTAAVQVDGIPAATIQNEPGELVERDAHAIVSLTPFDEEESDSYRSIEADAGKVIRS
jgi:hypothetical protein